MRFVACRLPLLALLVLPLSAAAQPGGTTGVLGFRSPPGAIAPATLQHLDVVLWQRVASVTSVPPAGQAQVEAALGAHAVRACAMDACMVQLARAAGLQKVVWGWAQPTPTGGFSLLVQVVDAATGAPRREEAGCPTCSEADMLAYFSAWDPSRTGALGIGGPPRPTPPAGAPPAAPPGPPGTPTAPTANQGTPPAAPSAGTSMAVGRLTLTTRPRVARVLLGGAEIGVTPMKDVDVPAGEHTLVLKRDGYDDFHLPVTVVAGETTTKKKVRLKAFMGKLVLRTKPAETNVSVDGKPIGKPPERGILLSPGTHAIAVQAPGYQPEQRTVVITVGKKSKLSVKLRATGGTLVVVAKPKGATVTVDGQVAGVAPLEALPLSLGSHEVRVGAQGFEESVQVVEIRRGKESRVKVKLKRAN